MTEVSIKNAYLVSAQRTLAKLATEKLDIGVSVKWAATKALQKIEELLKLLGSEENTLIKKYAKLTEGGEFEQVRDKEGAVVPNTWIFADSSNESKEKFSKEHAELMEAPNLLQFEKIKLSRLENSGLTGVELLAIEFIIDPEG